MPGLIYAVPPLTDNPAAFSRQVSRQWWGNTVGPVSFHDEWLSSGIAAFCTGLYDLAAYPDESHDQWVRARESLLHRPPTHSYLSELRPNDTGPIWMGELNDTYKTGGAGNIVSTSKGGYVLHILRGMMWDPKNGDADFRAMMQDFVKQFANQAVSTEDFKSVVDKHMKPPMDLDGNHRMDWFFNDWVYGTDVPSYRLQYSLAADSSGKWLLTGTLTQSGASPDSRCWFPSLPSSPERSFG